MHAVRGGSGFTVVEVLVAVTVISIGLLALAGTSAAVARMVSGSRQATLAVQAAERRLEVCVVRRTPRHRRALPHIGSATGTDGISERWAVLTGSGTVVLRVIVTHHTSRGDVTDTLATAVACA